MKYIRHIQSLFVLLVIAPMYLMAQDCVDYHKLGDCMMDRQKGYKLYSQSKSVGMSPIDTVEFNVVFYGQKDYKTRSSFCNNIFRLYFARCYCPPLYHRTLGGITITGLFLCTSFAYIQRRSDVDFNTLYTTGPHGICPVYKVLYGI